MRYSETSTEGEFKSSEKAVVVLSEERYSWVSVAKHLSTLCHIEQDPEAIVTSDWALSVHILYQDYKEMFASCMVSYTKKT